MTTACVTCGNQSCDGCGTYYERYYGEVPAEGDEDWTDADGGVRRVECSRCGEVRPCRWLIDPFIREVYPEDPVAPAEWCWPCYSDRHDEV